MKGNTVNDKIKAFYQKHEDAIKITVFTLAAAGLFALSIKIMKPNMPNVKVVDDLNDEEWAHLLDLARQMDEYVAERRALKSK